MAFSLDTQYLQSFLTQADLDAIAPTVAAAQQALHSGTGAGNQFLGWLTLPQDTTSAQLAEIKAAAAEIRSRADVLLVVGIGGSYLGARAAIEMLAPPVHKRPEDSLTVYFLGNSISGDAIRHILSLCEGRRVAVNVISKSGTTTEPAISFRFVLQYMLQRYGEEAWKRIWCTTDREKGSLRRFAQQHGCPAFTIPDNVGGRFSVLTPAGLLPIAAAGGDIEALLQGAQAAQQDLLAPQNDCCTYAAIRHLFYRQGRQIELFASYEPKFSTMGQWLIQLFGESQGKQGRGLYPSSAQFTTDLHSLGQYLQQGRKILFETVVDFTPPADDLTIPHFAQDYDGLGYLEGRSLGEINRTALQGTAMAHAHGGTPTVLLHADTCDAWHLGYLVYFFEKACAIGGYLLEVNPFDQPGVEGYKRAMFALLGKPGCTL